MEQVGSMVCELQDALVENGKKKKKQVWKIYIPKRSVVLIYYINLLPLFEAQIGN